MNALATARFVPLVGVPWVKDGRTTAGADCWGIVLLGLRRLGIEAADQEATILEAWARGWRPHGTDVPRGWEPVEDREPFVAGQVLRVDVDHVALYVGDGMVLHTMRGTDERPGPGSLMTPLRILRSRVSERWRWECISIEREQKAGTFVRSTPRLDQNHRQC